jgi:phosphoribosylformylglycinamidine cyclo-ligase
MLRTFNMGVGMTAVVPADRAENALAVLSAQGVEAWVIGELVEVAAGRDRVTISGAV